MDNKETQRRLKKASEIIEKIEREKKARVGCYQEDTCRTCVFSDKLAFWSGRPHCQYPGEITLTKENDETDPCCAQYKTAAIK